MIKMILFGILKIGTYLGFGASVRKFFRPASLVNQREG
jgi:hypothetical protein